LAETRARSATGLLIEIVARVTDSRHADALFKTISVIALAVSGFGQVSICNALIAFCSSVANYAAGNLFGAIGAFIFVTFEVLRVITFRIADASVFIPDFALVSARVRGSGFRFANARAKADIPNLVEERTTSCRRFLAWRRIAVFGVTRAVCSVLFSAWWADIV